MFEKRKKKVKRTQQSKSSQKTFYLMEKEQKKNVFFRIDLWSVKLSFWLVENEYDANHITSLHLSSILVLQALITKLDKCNWNKHSLSDDEQCKSNILWNGRQQSTIASQSTLNVQAASGRRSIMYNFNGNICMLSTSYELEEEKNMMRLIKGIWKRNGLDL